MTRILGSLLIIALASPVFADGILRRGLGPEPDSLDIHQAQGLAAINLIRDLREGLITFNAAGDLVPGVASEWTVSEEGTVYRFELREDARLVRWHTGASRRLSSLASGCGRSGNRCSDCRFAVANRKCRGHFGRKPAARTPLGVSVVSERILEIRLARATPWFPEILTHPVSFPLHERQGNIPELEVKRCLPVERVDAQCLYTP